MKKVSEFRQGFNVFAFIVLGLDNGPGIRLNKGNTMCLFVTVAVMKKGEKLFGPNT